jgi:hypothetical protein
VSLHSLKISEKQVASQNILLTARMDNFWPVGGNFYFKRPIYRTFLGAKPIARHGVIYPQKKAKTDLHYFQDLMSRVFPSTLPTLESLAFTAL